MTPKFTDRITWPERVDESLSMREHEAMRAARLAQEKERAAKSPIYCPGCGQAVDIYAGTIVMIAASGRRRAQAAHWSCMRLGEAPASSTGASAA